MSTLFYNGRFFQSPAGGGGGGGGGEGSSEEGAAVWADCLLANGAQIQHVGSEADAAVAAAAPSIAARHDMGGRVCLPGFVDGHMHLMNLGLSLQKCDLRACRSLADIREAIRAWASARPEAPRILCANWMHSMTGGEALASAIDDLDARPIFIEAKDLHSSWLSTSALAELGVHEGTPDPEGGKIHRDEAGRPTGLLSESAAIAWVWPHLARSASAEQKHAAIRDVVRSYSAAGYTGMVEMAMDDNAWAALQAYREAEDVPLRIAAHWLVNPKPTAAENLAQVDRAVELSRQFNEEVSPNCRVVGIKLILDGIIDGCTAALTEPYADGSSPDLIWALPELAPVVQRASDAGLQCALHAIGDLAVKTAVDALEQYGGGGGGTPDRPSPRHRIEHLEITRPEDAARLGRLGITASIHPVHADPAILRAWPSLIGAHRCDRAFAYTDFARGGATLAIGSDAPSAPIDPLRNIYTATTRRSAREPEMTTQVNPHFALDLTSAVVAATRGAAYSCFAEGWCGSLEPGKSADFVAVDMEWEADKLLSATPVQTWFMGKKVFER